ncbi:MAG: hypothetical protein GQ569_09015, partial [Methylococcaceae bacterium]|nr:hypothetical protein [Methylococcaceae bacterium]
AQARLAKAQARLAELQADRENYREASRIERETQKSLESCLVPTRCVVTE